MTLPPPAGHDEVFAVQVLRYLDGQASVQDLSELKEALATRRECRAQFVQLCRLHGELSELLVKHLRQTYRKNQNNVTLLSPRMVEEYKSFVKERHGGWWCAVERLAHKGAAHEEKIKSLQATW